MRNGRKPTAVLIGASGEIGTAIGRALADDGFRVVGTYRRLPETRACSGCEESDSVAHMLDVTDSKAVTEFFRRIELTYGSPYALVYIAGRMHDRPIALMSDETWRDIIDVNLTGAFSCVRAVARSMMVGGDGRIVLVGSVSSRIGVAGQAAYAASKAGLEALARVAAVEFGRYGISCNVVAPGPIDSGMFRKVADAAVLKTVHRTSLRRLGTADEVAATVRYLLRADAAFVTGQAIVMDGGLSAS
jgi:3-oxoacyl-[acyl-carrier protein] reductase